MPSKDAWVIEVRSTDPEFFADMDRAIVRSLEQTNIDEWMLLQSVEQTETSSVMVTIGDLSSSRWLSGEHRRVRKEADGKIHSNWCQVEIYPLGQPEIPVEFVSWPALGMASADPPTIEGRSATGNLKTPYRHSNGKAIKAMVVDVLSSRPERTDRQVLNWVLAPGREYGANLLTDHKLDLDDYFRFFDGDFTVIARPH